MSDKIKQTVNKVVLTGKVAEFEKATGKTKNGVPYISIKGVIQFGSTKAESRRFEKFCQEYSEKDGKKKENKMYPKVVEWANKVKSIASSTYDEATDVSIVGSFGNSDYVDKEEKLKEAIKIEASFFNDVESENDYKAIADIEGYIQQIIPETKGNDGEETGRLKVTILAIDFFGNVVPIRNIIVPAELREGFEDNYEVGQTATVYIDFKLNKAEAKPKKKGGLGVQRETEGKSYVEMILVGADPAIDEDKEGVLSKESIKIALSERKAKLEELKEKGYQGNKNSNSISSAASKPAPVADEDIPF